MIAELGLFSLCWALIFACLLVIVPTLQLYWKKFECYRTLHFYVISLFSCLALSYGCLTFCFLRDDFTVTYVLMNSSLALPWFYKLCAVWGGHEGSMLLWVLILSIWTLLVYRFSRQLDEAIRIRVCVILGVLTTGFILFLLTTSNPFVRQFQILQSQGRDLNPLLQDPGFLFHPPMLYMGYVGFSVAFAFAIATLWAGRVETTWSKWARPWTLAAWSCLTIGITLGSWWAYRELGWGGWWFWDPVENASFMPWLVGTALIHSLMVSEKRQQFVAWTLLLAITAFSLSLVGTFLVRSGVLTSVHAFAVDPRRGSYILGFLLFVVGGSLTLFAARAHLLVHRENPGVISRESALLLNNVFLVVAMLTVLLGTVYPLLIDGLGLGKLSVGAPYFNTVFSALMIPMLMLMGVGIHLRWRQDQLIPVIKRLGFAIFMSLLLPLLMVCFYKTSQPVSVYLGCALACWIILSTSQACYERVRKLAGKKLGQSFIGMAIAHIGVAVTMLGMVVSSGYGVQEDVRMAPGDSTTVAHYQIKFINEHPIKGPNYHGTQASFQVNHNTMIYPEKRIYDVGKMVMTESAIDVTPLRDIYLALGEPLDEQSWSVRLYYKPLVRWIWGGGFLILFGGLCALLNPRYLSQKT